jgi:hypothetical protein
LRQAKRLGLPGLVAVLMVIGAVFLGGSRLATPASAQTTPIATATVTKACTPAFTGATSTAPILTDCTLTVVFPAATTGTTVTITSLLDQISDLNANFAGSGSTATSCVNAPTFPVLSTTTTTTFTCVLPAITVNGPTNLCEDIKIRGTVAVGTGAGAFFEQEFPLVCPPNPTPPNPVVNPLSGLKVTKTCAPDFRTATATSNVVTDCTLVFTAASGQVFPNSTTLAFDTIQDPSSAHFNEAAIGGPGATTTGCELGTGSGGVLSNSNQTFTCVVGPIVVVNGSTTLCEIVQLKDAFGHLSDKVQVCPPGSPAPTPTAGLNFTATKTCTTPVPATVPTGGSSLTDCTVTFTALSGQAFPTGTFVATDVITTPGATFTSTGSNTLTFGAGPGFCGTPPNGGTISGGVGIGGGFTLTCVLPAISLTTIPNQVCEDVELGAPSVQGLSNKVNVCGFPVPTPTPVSALQPTGETKSCTNVVTTAGPPAVIGTGTGTSFTIPLFASSPSTCTIQLQRGANPCSATNVCADGNLQVTLSTSSPAVLGCDGASVAPAGGTGSVGNGACQVQNGGLQVTIPCGTTAPSGTTVSNTCSQASFTIQSLLNLCSLSPTVSAGVCANFNGSNFNFASNTTATVTIVFLATPGNGGPVGGITLGTNSFTFQAPGVGALLVSATPGIIPSNGTTASVITATFACGSVAGTLVNGFPLSSTGFTGAAGTVTSATNVQGQPILANGLTVCGAGLPGTFTFATPGPVIFDNGRNIEEVGCGLGGNVNPFGSGANPFFPQTGSTFPIVYSCTGAAVLAIGAGAAGDAPVNVTYQSSIGGLTAVGSTFIVVSPSGVPRISVLCNPSTIAAGSTGSICTATVTDINGVPLNGLTGATVTWTVSDPANASILPCLVNIPGNINITTSPTIVPQITPNTPCQVPTGQIPGQNNTFLNGQASALLVASPTAHPETVTVTASLGILIPPSFSCLVAPNLPTAFGTVTSPFAPITGVGLPGVTGCGTSNPVGFTGLASAISFGQTGLNGIVTLPNTTSASTTVNIGGVAGILIAGAGPNTPVQLGRGCNQVIVTTTVGTPIANIAALVSPASAVVSIWRFSNATKQFQAGFFSDPAAPTDFATTGAVSGTGVTGTTAAPGTQGNQITETYFICVNQAATITSG